MRSTRERRANSRAYPIAASAALLIASFSSAAMAAEPMGLAPSALPGVYRVGAPTATDDGIAIAASAGYGLTERLVDGDALHHRLLGTLSLGVIPIRWLQLGAHAQGRIDLHDSGADGPDRSAVGEPILLLRAGHEFSPAVSAGVELAARFPGADAPSIAFDATTLDARALFGWRPSSNIDVYAAAGFRLDNSANSIEEPERLGFGDRISLGVSDFNAILAGIGGIYQIGATELLAELTWEPLVGENAPAPTEAPLRAAVGGRHAVSSSLQLGATAEFTLGSRPDVSAGAALVPVEPRAQLVATATYRFGVEPVAHRQTPEPAVERQPVPTRERAAPEPAPGVPERTRVTVLGPDGAVVADAVVLFEAPDQRVTFVWRGEYYQAEGVEEGTGTLFVQADGYEDVERAVTIDKQRPLNLEISLEPALPRGQIRGLVRAFSGKPIQAEIAIEPSSKQITAQSDGRFSIDVPPGKYKVTISAAGYKTQERNVLVEEKGVVILNADLLEAR